MNIEKQALARYAAEWEGTWAQRPFNNNNGLSCQGALALYYFLKEMRPVPEIVFEIGTWRGFSTWVIKQALPNARIVCSDPILASKQFLNPAMFQPEYRLKEVEYTWQDFSNLEIVIPPELRDKVVVFFDDHQNKLPRVHQAKEKGFKHIIFDDNAPFDYTHMSLENLFRHKPERKEAIMNLFSRYEIFPPMFDALSIRGDQQLTGALDTPEQLPSLYESRRFYSWITRVELKGD